MGLWAFGIQVPESFDGLKVSNFQRIGALCVDRIHSEFFQC